MGAAAILHGGLVVELSAGDSISIDSGRVLVTLVKERSNRLCLRFSADRSVPIDPVRARPAITEGTNHDKVT